MSDISPSIHKSQGLGRYGRHNYDQRSWLEETRFKVNSGVSSSSACKLQNSNQGMQYTMKACILTGLYNDVQD